MWLRERLARLLPWGRRDRVDREVSRELALHLELETRRNIEQGMSPEDAMRAARAALGNVPLIREDVRAVWCRRRLDALVRSLAHMLRSLRRTPGFSLATDGVLALGTGGTTAIFTLIDGVMLRPLPVSDPARLYRIGDGDDTSATARHGRWGTVLVPAVRAIEGRSTGVRGRNRVRLGRQPVERPAARRGRGRQAGARTIRHRIVFLHARRRRFQRPPVLVRVAQQANEIGIRMALGADRVQVIMLVLRQAFRRVAVGLVLGLPLAVGAVRLMASQLHGLSFWDPFSLAVAAGSLAGCALVAAIIPAGRAAAIVPMRSL